LSAVEGNERRPASSTPAPDAPSGDSAPRAESPETDNEDGDKAKGGDAAGASDGTVDGSQAETEGSTGDSNGLDDAKPTTEPDPKPVEEPTEPDTAREESTGTQKEPTGTPVEPTGDQDEPTGTQKEPTGTPEEPTGNGAAVSTNEDVAVTEELPTVTEPARTFEVRTAPAALAPPTSPPHHAGPGRASPVPEAPPGDGTQTVAPGPRHMRQRPMGRMAKDVDDEKEAATARERRRKRIFLAAALSPLLLLLLLILAWAVDTAALSGQVPRNVELAGRSVGGKGEASLPDVMSAIAADVAERPVTITADGTVYEANAEELGLALDQEATAEAATRVGRSDSIVVRPFKWLGSFFSPREVSLRYTVTELQTAGALQMLQGEDLTSFVNPSLELTPEGFVVVPGQAGSGIDVAEVASELLAAAEAEEGPIAISVDKTEVSPDVSDADAQELADRANNMTAEGIDLTADSATASLSAEQLRAWITPVVDPSELDLTFDSDAANAAIPGLFSDLQAPVNATVELQGGTPVVVPGSNGVSCCGEDPAAKVWEALEAGETSVELEAVVTEPEHTTEEVQGWGISQPVGGSRAWQNGTDIPGPKPGFTTYHACCQSRVHNIQRLADLIRGAVIPPGGSFSINDHVGPRTREKGFVEAGAIRDGMHVPEVGGGVSQFATTMFNAAYFAGLDITTYQAHTEYFSRYPRGREATMGHPAPDLVIQNNTDYGVLIDTSYTGDSLTVTLWSTPYATAEQTAISESPSGNCTTVVTTRTRTFPDGETRNDQFRATYRPGEGEFC
jgi:vancomycin resistance protein YoaR